MAMASPAERRRASPPTRRRRGGGSAGGRAPVLVPVDVAGVASALADAWRGVLEPQVPAVERRLAELQYVPRAQGAAATSSLPGAHACHSASPRRGRQAQQQLIAAFARERDALQTIEGYEALVLTVRAEQQQPLPPPAWQGVG